MSVAIKGFIREATITDEGGDVLVVDGAGPGPYVYVSINDDEAVLVRTVEEARALVATVLGVFPEAGEGLPC